MKYIITLICSILLISCDNGTTIIPVNDFSFSLKKDADNQNKNLLVEREINYLLIIDAVEKGSRYTLTITSSRRNDLTFEVDNTEYKTGDTIPILSDRETITITTTSEDIGAHDLGFTLIKKDSSGSNTPEEERTQELTLPIEVITPDFFLQTFSFQDFQSDFPSVATVNLQLLYDDDFINPDFDFSLLKTQGNFKIEYRDLNNDRIEISNGSFPLFEDGNLIVNGDGQPYYGFRVTPLDNQTGQLKFTITATDQYGVSKSIDVTIQVIAT